MKSWFEEPVFWMLLIVVIMLTIFMLLGWLYPVGDDHAVRPR